MKALAIGFENEEFDIIKKLVLTNISKNSIVFFSEESDLIDVLTSEGPFSYILINLDEKHYSTQEIHANIEEIIGNRPFIFIGTANSIKSQLTSELINNHKTNHILEIPILPNDFKKVIASCELWIKNEDFEQSIQEFNREEMRALRIKNFFLFEKLPYDVFLEVAPNRYGKIISKNKFFSHQLLHNYSKKSIRYLYIKKNEHLKILDTSIQNLLQIYKVKHIERNKLVQIHQRTMFFIQEYIKCLSVTEEVNLLSHMLTDSITQFTLNNKSILKIFDEIDNLGQISFADASLITAYICEFIVMEMQWSSDMTKERLVLASVLQDIYLTNDELIKIRSLNDPVLKTFSEEDQLMFEVHPLRAQEVAKLFHGYTEFDFILKDHHEHPSGDGFPSGLNTSMLTTISCIFILATHFTSRMARMNSNKPDYNEILTGMKKTFSVGNFKEPMKALTAIFN